MLEAIFTSGIDEITVSGLTQWDRGQIISVTCPDITELFQVHFAYKGGAKASVGWGKFGKLPWIDYSEEPVPPTPPTPTPEEPIYYTVKRGDALYKIANKYDTTIAKLVEWNNIKNPNLIYVGQKLIVGYKNPEPTPPEPEKVYYTVKKGDNLTRIAEKYGTTVSQIVAWNNIANPNIIYVGQVLRVK